MTEKDHILLDPEKAQEQKFDPLGNQYHVTVSKHYPGLYTVELKDPDNAQKMVPNALRGHWTNHDRANRDLDLHLKKMWAKSNPKRGASRKEEQSSAAIG